MHKLQDLRIGHRALQLATEVYKATANFSREEQYGLTSQIRRSAVSASSNTAEGAGRNSNKEFCYFLAISNGSSYELPTQLIISNNLKLIEDSTLQLFLQNIDEIQKMNYKLQGSMKKVNVAF